MGPSVDRESDFGKKFDFFGYRRYHKAVGENLKGKSDASVGNAHPCRSHLFESDKQWYVSRFNDLRDELTKLRGQLAEKDKQLAERDEQLAELRHKLSQNERGDQEVSQEPSSKKQNESQGCSEAQKDDTTDQAAEEIASLQQALDEANRRLKQNSSNSSKPPSSDGLAIKPAVDRNRSLREKSGKKPGGQVGHQGHTCHSRTDPDLIVNHSPKTCRHCGSELVGDDLTGNHSSRQIIDLKDGKVHVIEHRALEEHCPCCQGITRAQYPESVRAPVPYGPEFMAMVCILHPEIQLPVNKIVRILELFLKIRISEGTVTTMCRKMAQRLEPVVEKLEEKICQDSKVKNLDETGFRVNGRLHWLHVAATWGLTVFRISEKRGAMFPKLWGCLVHDHWKPYYKVEGVKHALCNAHHLRELQLVSDLNPKEKWAEQMPQLLLRMNRWKKKEKGGDPDDFPELRGMLEEYDQILDQAIQHYESLPPLKQKSRGKQKKRKGHNLAVRLQEYKEDTSRFLTDPDVPFTNNQAENDWRMMKVRQKISGCFRTYQGAKDYAVLRSIVNTAKKQSLDLVETVMSSPDQLLAKFGLK